MASRQRPAGTLAGADQLLAKGKLTIKEASKYVELKVTLLGVKDNRDRG